MHITIKSLAAAAQKCHWFFLLVCIITFVGCKKEYNAPNEFADAYVVTTPYINIDSIQAGVFKIFLNKGETASFADLSIRVKSRKWFVEPGSGDILDSGNDTTSDLQKITVRYDKPGEFFVRLLTSVSSDSVGSTIQSSIITGSAGQDSTIYTIIKKPGTLDTTFIVKVYDSIRADFVTLGGTVHEAGIEVQYENRSTGDPNTFLWNFPGGNPATSTEANPKVVYKRTGTYNASLRVSRPSIPQNADGGSNTILKTGFITIIPSSAPLNFLQASILPDGNKITLSFNQEIIELPSPSEFTITADGLNKPIASITYPNPNDLSIIQLNFATTFGAASLINIISTTNIKADGKTLAAPINSTLFFAGAGNLMPLGYGNMEGPASFIAPVTGLFSTGSFSVGSGNNHYWRLSAGASSEASTDEFQGNYSMLFKTTAINNFVQSRFAAPYLRLTTGKTYRVVAFAKATQAGARLATEMYSCNTCGNALVGRLAETNISTGTWTKIEGTITITPTAPDYYLRFISIGSISNFLIDEINVFEL